MTIHQTDPVTDSVIYPDSFDGGMRWWRWELHVAGEDSFHGTYFTDLRDSDTALIQAKSTAPSVDIPWSLVRYETMINVTIEKAE